VSFFLSSPRTTTIFFQSAERAVALPSSRRAAVSDSSPLPLGLEMQFLYAVRPFCKKMVMWWCVVSFGKTLKSPLSTEHEGRKLSRRQHGTFLLFFLSLFGSVPLAISRDYDDCTAEATSIIIRRKHSNFVVG